MCSRVLVLLALQVGVAFCFTWDIVLGVEKRLEFFDNGILTHTEDIRSANYITSTTYDPVHYRIIFADRNKPNMSIFSFNLLNKKIQLLVTTKLTVFEARVVFEPVTQLLFWELGSSIYSFSINPASSNKENSGEMIVATKHYCYDIAVESCGGFIYWVTDYEIERARFDGSEREVLISGFVDARLSLAIDEQTQKMYWIEKIKNNYVYTVSIESADLNGNNRRTLYVVEDETHPDSLAVTKDFIYWKGYTLKSIWQLPKNQQQHEEAKLFPFFNHVGYYYQAIAANYTITEQTEGNEDCEPLKNLIHSSTDTKFTDMSMLCVHGTKVSGESRCECTQGYTGERCEVKACQNYCFQGDCSDSTEGKPKCRCQAGYSGERCEVNACHKHCLNNGVCSLNGDDEPVCECSVDYEGERCEVATTHTGAHTDSTTQHILQNVRRELRQAIQQELQHALQCFSKKIDE